MTGATDEEILFKSFNNLSSALLKMGSFVLTKRFSLIHSKNTFLFSGELCRHSVEPLLIDFSDTTPRSTNEQDEGIISLEEFETAIRSETVLIQWFQNIHQSTNSLTLDQRIARYHQDVLQ